MMRLSSKILFLSLALGPACFAPAATIDFAADTGTFNFSDTNTWVGGVVPGSGDIIRFNAGASTGNRTLVFDVNASVQGLDLRPRTTGFIGRTITLNTSGGSTLSIGSSGIAWRGGTLINVNVPIILTADQTWRQVADSGIPMRINTGGNAISGGFKITRDAGTGSTSYLNLQAGQNTFSGGFAQNGHATRIGASSAADNTSGPLGTGTLELTGGILASINTTARTLRNDVEVRGNITLGQAVASVSETAGGSGALTFSSSTGTPTTFNLHSAVNGTARTLTTVANVTISHGIGEAGGGTGLGLTKAGGGELTLSGGLNNTYTGDTAVNAGTLILNKTGGAVAIAGNLAIGDGTGTDTVRTDAANQFGPSSAVTLNAAGTPVFNLNGNSQSIRSLASDNTAASVALGGGTLTLSNLADTTFAGVISGTGGLVKQGAGNFTLSGASTYSGGTVINEGILTASAAGALGGTSGILVNPGGTLLLGGTGNRLNDGATFELAGGTFNTGGFAEEVGTFSLSASSIIDFGSGEEALIFAGAEAGWIGTLSIYNWTGTPETAGTPGLHDQLIFSAPANVVPHLDQIQFFSDSGTTFLGTGTLIGNEVVPTAVPEPTTVSALLAALALAAGRELRARRRANRDHAAA